SVVAATVKRQFATIVGIVVACLMTALLGVIAVTGRWPVDAPRAHVEKGGILSVPAEVIRSVEFSTGGEQSLFNHEARTGWLFNGAATKPEVADHIEIATRLLSVSAPRRILAATEYSAGQLPEYGLDPPRFVLAVAEAGDNTTRLGFGAAT